MSNPGSSRNRSPTPPPVFERISIDTIEDVINISSDEEEVTNGPTVWKVENGIIMKDEGQNDEGQNQCQTNIETISSEDEEPQPKKKKLTARKSTASSKQQRDDDNIILNYSRRAKIRASEKIKEEANRDIDGVKQRVKKGLNTKRDAPAAAGAYKNPIPTKPVTNRPTTKKIPKPTFGDDDEDDDEDDGVELRERYNLLRIERLEQKSKIYQIRHGLLDIHLNQICILCEETDVAYQHPMFQGGMCRPCWKEWRESVFACGPGGESTYCILCNNAGQLALCQAQSCVKGFCTGCIRDFVGPENVDIIIEAKQWLCFLCTEYNIKTHGLIEPREDWKTNVQKTFQPDGLVLPQSKSDEGKRGIRVLSLFDGISTGKVVLEKLGLHIDAYYASEVDEDAIAVSKTRHPDIIHQGDVRTITDAELRKLGPIDLLIGGSPCADFSRVNPNRKGLRGDSGSLFYEFNRILASLQSIQPNTHLFWLFENTASMEKEILETLNRFLRCPPAVWDARLFSHMKRKRNFWGNLPSIYCPVQYSESEITTKIKLEDCLMGSRKPNIDLVNCVTTNKNSLSLAVLDGDIPTTMWIPEIERLFGFEAHYTDVKDIPPHKRQGLLGKGWSIPVIMHLLRPLTMFYRCHSDV